MLGLSVPLFMGKVRSRVRGGGFIPVMGITVILYSSRMLVLGWAVVRHSYFCLAYLICAQVIMSIFVRVGGRTPANWHSEVLAWRRLNVEEESLKRPFAGLRTPKWAIYWIVKRASYFFVALNGPLRGISRLGMKTRCSLLGDGLSSYVCRFIWRKGWAMAIENAYVWLSVLSRYSIGAALIKIRASSKARAREHPGKCLGQCWVGLYDGGGIWQNETWRPYCKRFVPFDCVFV